MKMNNLSNPSRVILSNPARVILSVAKDLAVAFALFAFAACSDYLEDFQDKYDDGNAFAEISSDSDNGDDDGSSDSKLSSSNGGDSELSSSSKGNGDAESSDSMDSSSSATDPGSSSSVTESSSAFEPCKGTVIYDASKDSLNGIFGYPFMANFASGMQASSKGIKAKLRDRTEFLTLPLADLSNDKTRDIETWGGLCIEYSSDGQADFVLLNDSLEKVRRFLSNELPVTNGDKASFKWLWSENEKLQEKQAELGYSDEPLSINKVSRLHFDNYYLPKTTTITIFRITTINEVDLDVGSSSSVAESSSSAFEPCKGSVIYDASMDSLYGVFGYPFMTEYAELEANSSGVKATMKYAESEYQTLFLNLANSSNNETKDIEAWEGVCIEYSSDGNPSLNLNTPHEQNAWAATSLPQTKNNKETFTWRWNDIKQKGKAFSINKVGQLVFYSLESTKTTTITIHKITTLKPVDLGLNSVYNGLEPVNACGGKYPIYSADSAKNTTGYDSKFCKNATGSCAGYDSKENALIMNLDNTTNRSYTANINVPSDIANWGGVCIEYMSDYPVTLSVDNVEFNDNNYPIAIDSKYTVSITLPQTDDYKAFRIPWTNFSTNDDIIFNPAKLNAIQFSNNSQATTTHLKIKEIKSYN